MHVPMSSPLHPLPEECYHPQRVATHFAMLTFFDSLVRMNGCWSNCQGYGLSVPERIKLCSRSAIGPMVPEGEEDSPLAHKLLDVRGPGPSHGLVIDHQGHWRSNDITE